jgi:hypothetical protein
MLLLARRGRWGTEACGDIRTTDRAGMWGYVSYLNRCRVNDSTVTGVG